MRSHLVHNSLLTIDAGKFKGEIVPVEIPLARRRLYFDTDEFVNRATNLEKLGDYVLHSRRMEPLPQVTLQVLTMVHRLFCCIGGGCCVLV